jgi:NAD kinase
MNVALVSHYDKKPILDALKKHGFSLSSRPKFVFTYGGDGTILEAEKCYPGVPLIPIQRSTICSHCSVYSVSDLDKMLHAIKSGKYSIKEEKKIEAVFQGRTISALNDIQIHLKDPRRAVRFSVKTKKKFYKEVVGDGIVAATPYASDSYYRAIGYKPFKSGLRLGFNNAWPKLPSIDIGKGVVITITRENAWLAADNFFLRTIKRWESVTIRPSKKKARFVVLHNGFGKKK